VSFCAEHQKQKHEKQKQQVFDEILVNAADNAAQTQRARGTSSSRWIAAAESDG